MKNFFNKIKNELDANPYVKNKIKRSIRFYSTFIIITFAIYIFLLIATKINP